MNIFNRVIPWWVPTKNDQKKWYQEELTETPRETIRLLNEFQELSEMYNKELGSFESELTKEYPLYEKYVSIKSLAQKVNFLWNRIEYKTQREQELKERLKDL